MLSSVPTGGPLGSPARTAALQFGTLDPASTVFADAIAGEKTKR